MIRAAGENSPLTIALADGADRKAIYRHRHSVYALELRQHSENAQGELRDYTDAYNVYIVLKRGKHLVGFISITPPGRGDYSIDKYISRNRLPFSFDETLYEVRLLTVLEPHRGVRCAALLMYAALRWVDTHGGKRIVAVGRREIFRLYLRAGLVPSGHQIQSGEVTFELMSATVLSLTEQAQSFANLVCRLRSQVNWELDVPFDPPTPCLHGGAFFEAIGPEFGSLQKRREIINADVLDAWFPPAPEIVRTLREDLPWLLRTSPPTHSEGMIQAIARARKIPSESVVVGGGSSDLVFQAIPRWITRDSRVLLMDPMYGEYAHLLERVIGARTERLSLDPRDGWRLDLSRLLSRAQDHWDLIVLVNPNNPTGLHVSRRALEEVLERIPSQTRVWVDEAYVDYVGADESLERFAVGRPNVIVCKSMSKVYALSGVRCAYLCASEPMARALRAFSPPWAVSLPAQIAAVGALRHPDYYEERYEQTRRYRAQLAGELETLDELEVLPGQINFVLCRLSQEGPDAAAVVSRCRDYGLFLRDVSSISSVVGKHLLRIAVKDPETNRRIVRILSRVLKGGEDL